MVTAVLVGGSVSVSVRARARARMRVQKCVLGVTQRRTAETNRLWEAGGVSAYAGR